MDLPIAKLYLDDLKKIDEILKENSLIYKVTLDEYELESIGEILSIKDKQEFTKLSIRAIEPHFYLSLGTSLTARTWMSHEDDCTVLGVIEKIKPIIKERRNNWRFFSNILNFFLVIVVIILVWIYFETKNSSILMFANVILWSFIFKSLFVKEKDVVVFKSINFEERTSYFTRNKDQIITNILSASIGLVTGIVLTFLKVKLDSAH